MPRTRHLSFALALIAVLSCTDGGGVGPAVVDGDLSVVPSYSSALSSLDFLPITRIRVQVLGSSGGALFHEQVVAVDANAAQWTVDVSLPDSLTGRSIVIAVEAIHLTAGGAEVVQFSGQSAAFTGGGDIGRLPTVTVAMGAGPLSNQNVTSVLIGSHAAVLREGATVQLSATVQGGPAGATVFWSSLDPGVATVGASGVVTGVRGGTARIVAMAGRASDTTSITVASPPAAVTITPVDPTVDGTGIDVAFQAQVFDAGGAQITGEALVWASSDPAVATHQGNGVFRTTGAGTTTVRVSVGSTPSVTATTQLTVTVPVASIVLTPTALDLDEGESSRIQATALGADGAVLANTSFTWNSSNPQVATVDGSGLVTGLAPGATTITASTGSVSATASVVVFQAQVASVTVTPSAATLAVGGTVDLAVQAFSASGVALSGRVASWASSNPAVASVSNGTVTALAVGTTTVTATIGGQSASASITVAAIVQPVASVVVVPDSADVSEGGATAYRADLFAADGAALSGRPVAWTTANAAVATVDALGTVTGVSPGVTSVHATAEGISGNGIVVVTQVPVASVTVTPDSVDLGVGDTAALTAQAFDAGGAALSGRPVAWSSSDASVASVDAAGTVIGLAPGTTLVTATIDGISASAAVVVSLAPVDSVVVTPPTASALVGGTAQFSAQPLDSAGNALAGRAVTWTTSDASVATVDAAGLATGVAAGVASITATSEGVSGSASLTVGAVPVDSVAVTPPSANVLVGGTVQLTAQPLDAAGGSLAGRVVTWGTSDASVATVDAAGLVTGVAPGSATVTATSEGKSGASAVTVTSPPVDSVAVVPDTLVVPIAGSGQLTATTFDAAGNVLSGRVITWSSADPSIATVDGAGLVTGVAAGSTVVDATSEGVTGSSVILVQAPTGTPLTCGQPVSGSFGDAVFGDYFYAGAAGESVVLGLSATGSAEIEVRRPTSAVLGTIAGGDANVVTFIEGGAQRVLVQQQAAGQSGTYTMWLECPSPSSGTGSSVNVGDHVSGALATGTEMHHYTFNANAGDQVAVTFTSPSDFARVWWFDNGTYVQGSSSSMIPFAVPTGGQQSLVVLTWDMASTGSYGLSVTGLSPQTGNLGPVSGGDFLSGSISGLAEVHAYSLTGNAGDVVAIAASQVAFELYAPSGSYIAGAEDSFTFAYLSETGAHTLVVYDWNFSGYSGPYTLALENLLPPSPADGSLAIGDNVSGSLAAGELGLYTFSANAGDVVYFGAGGGADVSLFSAGSQLWYFQNDWRGITIPTSGMQAVLVAHSSLAATNFGFSVQGLTPFVGDGSITPGTPVSGSIDDAGDLDSYSFSGSVGELYVFGTDALNSEIRGPSGGRGGTGLTTGFPFVRVLQESGVHSLGVFHAGMSATGAYTANVVGLNPANPASAPIVVNGASVSGSISGAVEMMVHPVTIPGSGTLDLMFEATPANQVQALVYDAAGTILGQITGSAAAPGALSLSVTAGSYYVLVFGNNLVATGSYIVGATFN